MTKEYLKFWRLQYCIALIEKKNHSRLQRYEFSCTIIGQLLGLFVLDSCLESYLFIVWIIQYSQLAFVLV